MCVIARLIYGQCVQKLMQRSNAESSCGNEDLHWGLVPRPEQQIGPAGWNRAQKAPHAAKCPFEIPYSEGLSGRGLFKKSLFREGLVQRRLVQERVCLRQGVAPVSRTARPAAWPAGPCGFWRSR